MLLIDPRPTDSPFAAKTEVTQRSRRKRLFTLEKCTFIEFVAVFT